MSNMIEQKILNVQLVVILTKQKKVWTNMLPLFMKKLRDTPVQNVVIVSKVKKDCGNMFLWCMKEKSTVANFVLPPIIKNLV